MKECWVRPNLLNEIIIIGRITAFQGGKAIDEECESPLNGNTGT